MLQNLYDSITIKKISLFYFHPLFISILISSVERFQFGNNPKNSLALCFFFISRNIFSFAAICSFSIISLGSITPMELPHFFVIHSTSTIDYQLDLVIFKPFVFISKL